MGGSCICCRGCSVGVNNRMGYVLCYYSCCCVNYSIVFNRRSCSICSSRWMIYSSCCISSHITAMCIISNRSRCLCSLITTYNYIIISNILHQLLNNLTMPLHQIITVTIHQNQMQITYCNRILYCHLHIPTQWEHSIIVIYDINDSVS